MNSAPVLVKVGRIRSRAFAWHECDDKPAEPLTPRQLEILTLVADGYERKEIAEILVISEATVRTTLEHTFRRLSVKNSIQAINAARRYGFLPPQGIEMGRQMSDDPTGRLRLLVRLLDTHVDDLGYQGLTDAERETATVLAALRDAIDQGKTKGLAAAVAQWMDAA